MEAEELVRILKFGADEVSTGSPRKEEEEPGDVKRREGLSFDEEGGMDKVVCVTSGASFLGLAIVNRLLSRGYSVRILVDSQDDIEKLRELKASWDTKMANHITINPVVAQLTQIGILLEAFDGCRGVFHTAGFIDSAGLSGYTKSMAEIEVKACENVMEACSRTPSARRGRGFGRADRDSDGEDLWRCD